MNIPTGTVWGPICWGEISEICNLVKIHVHCKWITLYAVCFTVLLSYIKLLSILGVCLKCISKVHSVWVDCWVTECTHCMFDCVLLSILGVHVCLSVFRLRWSNRRRMDRQTIGWSSTSDSWTANHRLSWTRSVVYLSGNYQSCLFTW